MQRAHTPLAQQAKIEEAHLGFEYMVFGRGRESPILGVWAAPAAQKPFQKVGGEAPHLLEWVLGAAEAPHTQQNQRFPAGSKNHV